MKEITRRNFIKASGMTLASG
ncbi:MAG: twin-arginine translocation signal domain-containing protein, partial [Prevotellaceae bacterium]|nr:twin-arginine translocation signal domain-containing protein [Prevotellaceae bacterium]